MEFELVGPITNVEVIGLTMKSAKPFALCVDNTGYEVSLIVGKVFAC